MTHILLIILTIFVTALALGGVLWFIGKIFNNFNE